MMRLDEFVQWRLRGGPDRFWLEQPGFKVYVRLGPRTIRLCDAAPQRYAKVLDIANIEVKARGQGTFTRFLNEAETIARTYVLNAIYIELVQDGRFANFFVRHGFLLCDNADQALSLAKVFDHSREHDDEAQRILPADSA